MTYMESRTQDHIESGMRSNEDLAHQNQALEEMVKWAFPHLHDYIFFTKHDVEMMDRIRLWLEHGLV